MATRLEIIDYTKEIPREVLVLPEDKKVINYQLQDNNRTLKIFIDRQTREEKIMNTFVHDDTVWAQNEDGTWSESIPLPYMGLRKSCWFCGAKFFRAKSYQDHYRCLHTDGLAYIRKPEGFLTSYRICRGIDKPLPETLIYRKPSTPEKDTL